MATGALNRILKNVMDSPKQDLFVHVLESLPPDLRHQRGGVGVQDADGHVREQGEDVHAIHQSRGRWCEG